MTKLNEVHQSEAMQVLRTLSILLFGLVLAAITGCNSEDSEVTLIRDNLFQDANGNLQFRVQDQTQISGQPVWKYLSSIGPPGQENPIPLSSIISKESWRKIYPSFYTDGSTLFCHYITAGGGWLLKIEAVEPNLLKPIQDKRELLYFTDGNTVLSSRCEDHGSLYKWRKSQG